MIAGVHLCAQPTRDDISQLETMTVNLIRDINLFNQLKDNAFRGEATKNETFEGKSTENHSKLIKSCKAINAQHFRDSPEGEAIETVLSDISMMYPGYHMTPREQHWIETFEQYVPLLVKYLKKNGVDLEGNEQFKLLTAFPSTKEKQYYTDPLEEIEKDLRQYVDTLTKLNDLRERIDTFIRLNGLRRRVNVLTELNDLPRDVSEQYREYFAQCEEYLNELENITEFLKDDVGMLKGHAIEQPAKYLREDHPIARPEMHDPFYYLAIDIYENVELIMKYVKRFHKNCKKEIIFVSEYGFDVMVSRTKDLIKFIETFRECSPNLIDESQLTRYTEFKKSFLHVNKYHSSGSECGTSKIKHIKLSREVCLQIKALKEKALQEMDPQEREDLQAQERALREMTLQARALQRMDPQQRERFLQRMDPQQRADLQAQERALRKIILRPLEEAREREFKRELDTVALEYKRNLETATQKYEEASAKYEEAKKQGLTQDRQSNTMKELETTRSELEQAKTRAQAIIELSIRKYWHIQLAHTQKVEELNRTIQECEEKSQSCDKQHGHVFNVFTNCFYE